MKRSQYRRRMRDATPEERSCTRKVRYVTEIEARLETQKAMFKSHGRKQVMWIYNCPLCDGFHATSTASGPEGRVTMDALAPNGWIGARA